LPIRRRSGILWLFYAGSFVTMGLLKTLFRLFAVLISRSAADHPPRPAPQVSAAIRAPQSAPAHTLRGPAFVVDGDTITIKGQSIRLAGIDAPELDHPYGQKARWA
jgi:endonuclease YncB( thermonuclease family)